MVPGLMERAGRATTVQSREWLTEALREQALSVSTPVRPRRGHHRGRAAARDVSTSRLSSGRRACAAQVAKLAVWRTAVREHRARPVRSEVGG